MINYTSIDVDVLIVAKECKVREKPVVVVVP